MSRIGNRKLTIPSNVEIKDENGVLTVKGPKGELSLSISPLLKINVSDGTLTVEKVKDTKEANTLSGTTNANINNMLIGVTEGFKKELEAVGVGYRFSVSGNKVVISAGYSHNVELAIPAGLTANCPSNTELTISGHNNQAVSEFAANVRKVREPEPYKGKGIRYKGEYVRRKEGKKAAK